MAQVFVEDYIQKILLLEQRLGVRTSYRMLEPFALNTRDVVVIQTAARNIAEFIGLHGLTFIVGTATQKEGVAGHIQLKHGENEAFLEISSELLGRQEAVEAALAHEITHKYLHINGIRCGTGPAYEYENEVLNDVAAVFLGLGKLLLNGYQWQEVSQELEAGSPVTFTRTHRIGYLDRGQVAFVYLLTCAMRQISPSEYERGLSGDSIQALQECRSLYGYYFGSRFHHPDITRELAAQLRSAIRDAQSRLCNLDRSLLFLVGSCVNVVQDFLQTTHRRLARLLLQSREMVDDSENDPCLKFLNAMRLAGTVEKLVSEVTEFSCEARRYEPGLTQLVDFVQACGNPFAEPTPDMFTIVTCPNDGTKLRLPEGKRQLIARCPNCQYDFVADTSVRAMGERASAKRPSRLGKLLRWLTRRR